MPADHETGAAASTPAGGPAPLTTGTAAIFDLDGTLADTMPVHYRAWAEVAARFQIVFTEPRFYSLGGVPTVEIARLLLTEQNLTVDPVIVTRAKEEAVMLLFHEVQPIAAVVEIARRARAVGPVAIASGGGRRMVERTLAHIGLADWFPVVVTAEDTTRHKPEPDVFWEAARRMGVTPAQCTVYEDTDLGLEAARRAGMRGVDVRPLYLPRPPQL